MEAANPRSREPQQPSSSGVGSLIQTFERLTPSRREESLKQLAKTSTTLTTEHILGMTEELGVEIPRKLLRADKQRIAKYIDDAMAKGKAPM
jgi:hypothetical protein